MTCSHAINSATRETKSTVCPMTNGTCPESSVRIMHQLRRLRQVPSSGSLGADAGVTTDYPTIDHLRPSPPGCPHVRPLRSRVSQRACGAGGSQYKHGSSGLSHADSRADVWCGTRCAIRRACRASEPPLAGCQFRAPDSRAGCGHIRTGGTVFVLRARGPARRGSGAPDVPAPATP